MTSTRRITSLKKKNQNYFIFFIQLHLTIKILNLVVPILPNSSNFTNFQTARNRRFASLEDATMKSLLARERIERRISSALKLWSKPSKSLWIRVGRINHGRFNVISRFRFDAPTFRAHHRGIFLHVGWFSAPYGGGRGTKHMLPAVHSIYFATSSLSRTGKITEAKGKGSKGIGMVVKVEISKSGTKVLVGQPRVVEIDSDTLEQNLKENSN